jgi:hypothetical protein
MDLICYLHPSWKPLIRPAESTREWMTDTPESYAYRCLPLNMGNAHGWEILNPGAFRARWTGGMGVQDIEIECEPGSPEMAPVSIFGQGVLTFHIQGLFRTQEGFNLWVGASPNRFKDAIQPLTGLIETDWSPYTFTMNWKFTRPGHWVTFEGGEPICFFQVVQRGLQESIQPRFESFDDHPEIEEAFMAWSHSRDAFREEMVRDPHRAPADKWQKLYYRGVAPDGSACPVDHQAKLRLKPFPKLED